jgi:hypothetical protein
MLKPNPTFLIPLAAAADPARARPMERTAFHTIDAWTGTGSP